MHKGGAYFRELTVHVSLSDSTCTIFRPKTGLRNHLGACIFQKFPGRATQSEVNPQDMNPQLANQLLGQFKWVFAGQKAGYYKLMNKWTWLKSPVWLSWLKVHLGSALESAFQQKQKYSMLRVCIEFEVKQSVLYFN